MEKITFKASTKHGLTLSELEAIVKRARMAGFNDGARVRAPHIRLRNFAVLALEFQAGDDK